MGHSVDENVVAEVDDEEEDNMSLDLLTTIPSAAHSAPSKGKSPAHRQVRHQRNARRILDSWMADDDSNSPNSDGTTINSERCLAEFDLWLSFYFCSIRPILFSKSSTAT